MNIADPIVIASDKFIYSPNGLQIHPSVTYEEWATYGQYLGRGYSAMQWAIGDWINFGEGKFGEMYAQALNDTDLAYGTLRNYASICARIPVVNRDPRLRFHQVKHVACLEPDEQQKIVTFAIEHKLTGEGVLEVVQKVTGKRRNSDASEGEIISIEQIEDRSGDGWLSVFVRNTEDWKRGQKVIIRAK